MEYIKVFSSQYCHHGRDDILGLKSSPMGCKSFFKPKQNHILCKKRKGDPLERNGSWRGEDGRPKIITMLLVTFINLCYLPSTIENWYFLHDGTCIYILGILPHLFLQNFPIQREVAFFFIKCFEYFNFIKISMVEYLKHLCFVCAGVSIDCC